MSRAIRYLFKSSGSRADPRRFGAEGRVLAVALDRRPNMPMRGDVRRCFWVPDSENDASEAVLSRALARGLARALARPESRDMNAPPVLRFAFGPPPPNIPWRVLFRRLDLAISGLRLATGRSTFGMLQRKLPLLM